MWRNLRLRLIECSQILMVRLLLVKECVVSDFNASRMVILTLKTGIAVEERRFSKMQNWRHYLQDSCQNQEKLARSLGVTQQAISKRLKAMGMIQKQGNWVPYELKPRDVERRLLLNSCLKGKDGRDFCIALWLGTKNRFITIIPSAENHGEFPAIFPRRRPNRIFTVPRSCSVFGGTSA